MRGRRWVVLLCLGSGLAALAQDTPAATPSAPTEPPPPAAQPIPDAPPAAAVPPPATLVPPAAAAPAAAVNVAKGTWFGAYAAVNIGLIGVDLHVDRSYTFLAGNLGVPLVTNGDFGAFAVGSGYSFPLSAPGDSMWVLDVFGVVNPGWQRRYDACFDFGCSPVVYPFVGLGAGVGFRFLHWSGFTFGIKAPVFGAAINGGNTTSAAVGTFYLANLVGLPIFSFGFRW